MECIAEDEGGVVCCAFNKPMVLMALHRAGFWNVKSEALGEHEGHEYALFAARK